VPHGRAVGLGLRAALGWNAEAAPAPHAAVADAFGVAQAPDASDEARALALATAFDDFLRQVGMDLDLAGDGLAARDADRVAEAILRPENSPMLASNCRSVDAAGAARLSRNLFAGP
jgi:alcohol dehydrogenase class IV